MRVVSPSQASPLLSDTPCRQIGIPGQPAEPVKVGHCQVVTQPVAAGANISNGNESPNSAVESPARNQLLNRRTSDSRLQVEVEDFLPHRRQVNQVPLLPGVLLRDLQLDRLACLL